MYKKTRKRIREPTNKTSKGITCNNCIFNQICEINNNKIN